MFAGILAWPVWGGVGVRPPKRLEIEICDFGCVCLVRSTSEVAARVSGLGPKMYTPTATTHFSPPPGAGPARLLDPHCICGHSPPDPTGSMMTSLKSDRRPLRAGCVPGLFFLFRRCDIGVWVRECAAQITHVRIYLEEEGGIEAAGRTRNTPHIL